MNERDLDLSTRTVRAGIEDDRHHGAVVPPLHLSSTFTFSDLGCPRRYDYSRSGNPTRDLLADALSTPSDMVWLESPTNPLLRVVDIRGICELAHAGGARVVVDNTFLTPALQQPLRLGADVVVHSTTKYINGHSDVLGGAVVCLDAETAGQVAWWANSLGLTGGAFDSWMTLRGLRTLEVRMRQHQENAGAVAALLADHPAVARVHYPGLESHPQHCLAVRQQRGFGGIVSLDLVGGKPAVRQFVSGLQLFSLAESLGGVESLVAHPATMTHAAMSTDARRAAGIGEGLLRLSVGLESTADLCRDLIGALDRTRFRAASGA